MSVVKSSVPRDDGVAARLGPLDRSVNSQRAGPWPLDVRIGQGALIDDDVCLGSDMGSPTSGAGIEIGKRARIRSGSAIRPGARVGDRLDAGRNVVVGEGTLIGKDCRISNNTIVESDCQLGDRVRVDANCFIGRFTTIADDVTIGAGVCLANDPHPGSETHACMRGPTIETGAQIGMNATIFPFVTIGQRSVVQAGSVVTNDVAPGLVVAGNPARVLMSVAQISCPLDLKEGEYQRPQIARE
jgi:acetyltransferase-like isoleucine patch superfamily enzyme